MQQSKIRMIQVLSVLALLVLIVFAGVIAHLVINLVTIGVGLLVLAALWFMTPPFLYALNIGSRQIDRVITQANPVDALKIELAEFNKYVDSKRELIVKAKGNLASLKIMFNENKNSFTPDNLSKWNDSISRHERAINVALTALSDLEKERENFRTEIQNAESDMAMAALSNDISGAINGSDSRAASERRQVALNSINQRVAQSQARMDMALNSLGQQELT